MSCRINYGTTSWSRIVPRAIDETSEGDILATASILLDIIDQDRVDKRRVGECPRFFETEDEDTRGRGLYDDIGIAKSVLDLEWNVHIADCVAISWANFDASKELSSGFGNTDQEQEDRSQNGSVNAEFDRGEDRDENACSPDEKLQWRDEPEGVNLARGCDEIGDGVDDNGGKAGKWDEEESIRETVEGDDDDDSGDPTCCRSSDTALGFESGAREGTSSGDGGEERSDSVRHSDS